MFKKVSLGFPRTQSLNSVFSEKKKKNYFSKSKNGVLAPVALDRYLTNEGHRYVASILRRTQIQKDIQSGSLHKITEKDVDELLKSYYDSIRDSNINGGGVKVNVYETLNYENLNLSLHECKLLAKLLKSDDILTIKTLKLSKNNLHKSSLNSILNALHKNTTLKTLDLSFNSLTDADAKKVSKLLKKNNTIKELYLSFNRIGTEGAKSLSKALKQNSSVERFSLESNQLNSQGGHHIAEMLKVNKTIKYIHLGSNNLQITGMESIAEALKVNNTLVSLSLDINNITSEGTEFLSKALEVNKNLTHLYMSRNNIGDNGLKHLSKALLSNTTITYLDLEFNSIGDQIEGIESLGETLEKHVVPRAINLTNNKIGDEGCAALFSGFHKNKTLESIILSQCNIGLEGIKVISEALKNNEGLQNLSLHKNNDMGADGHLELAQALEQNTSLKSIQLDYNFVEWEMVGSSIHQSLTRNHLLQREKYNIACRILKVARIMLNASVKQQLPTFNKRNNINDDNKRNSIQQRFQLYQPTQNSPPTTVIPYASPPLGSNGDGDDNVNNNKLEFTKLPFEIQEQILFALDTNQVLTHMQKVSIIKWSLTKSTLGKSMEEFLTENLSAYYPLTSDVRLWPTEANTNYAEERF